MKYDIYGIGNALVDHEFEIEESFLEKHSIEKGLMTLIEESTQDALMSAIGGDEHEVKRQCGGSAANTMISLAQLGAKCFYSCRVANDESGKFYREELQANNVDSNLEQLPEGKTGKCLVMVTPDSDRTMNTFLGITAGISEQQLNKEALINSSWLYVEGYLVASPTGHAAALKALQIAQENNVKRSLTLSDASMVQFFRENMTELAQQKIDLLFCNFDEAKMFVEKQSVDECIEQLKTYAKSFVMTQGSEGSVYFDGQQLHRFEAQACDLKDTLGAGDMYAGAFLYALTQGLDAQKAGLLASHCCAQIVSQFGPRLETSQMDTIKKKVLG